MDQWQKDFLEVTIGISKRIAEILAVLATVFGTAKGFKWWKSKKNKNKENVATASETLIDVDKLMQTYAENMKRANDEANELRESNTECKKKNRILIDENYQVKHENGRKNLHIAATIQLINAHIKYCSDSTIDLKEFVILLQKDSTTGEFMQDFKGIAKRHGLYKDED